MKQSHLLSLATLGAGLLLLGAGCASSIPGMPTNTEVKIDTEVKTDASVPAKTTANQNVTCSETDGGNVLAVKGTTVLKGSGNSTVSSKTDYCGSDAKVFEYYCGNGGKSIQSTGANCPDNSACVDGACVSVAAHAAPADGVCGPSNGQLSLTTPVELCAAGVPGPVVGNGPWSWTCVGTEGGATVNCSAPKYLLNGVCGSANGAVMPSAPTSNLCVRGAASAVIGVGPWTWTCAGEEPGAEAANCKAFKYEQPLSVNEAVNGSCGTSHNATLIAAPTTNLCATGSPSAVTGEGPWTWNCVGAHGGTTANCTANVRIEP